MKCDICGITIDEDKLVEQEGSMVCRKCAAKSDPHMSIDQRFSQGMNAWRDKR